MDKEKLNKLLIKGYIETSKEDQEINQEWEKNYFGIVGLR